MKSYVMEGKNGGARRNKGKIKEGQGEGDGKTKEKSDHQCHVIKVP